MTVMISLSIAILLYFAVVSMKRAKEEGEIDMTLATIVTAVVFGLPITTLFICAISCA